MKQIMLILGILSIVLVTVTDIDAQRRRTRERDRKEDTEQVNKIFHTIHMGNINFFNGNFSLSSKYSGGYKFHERFGAGLSGKFFFDIFNQIGAPNINFFSYGAGAFIRGKITNDIYIQAEYDVTSYDDFNNVRDIYTYPLIGAGYEQGQGPWKFGANALFILDSEVQDIGSVNRLLEWWITFSYNF